MATHPDEPETLGDADRQVKEALRDCEELLVRARRLLRKTGQDNEPK
jgi:hypothetical protein